MYRLADKFALVEAVLRSGSIHASDLNQSWIANQPLTQWTLKIGIPKGDRFGQWDVQRNIEFIPGRFFIRHMDPPNELGIVCCQFLDNLARSIEAITLNRPACPFRAPVASL